MDSSSRRALLDGIKRTVSAPALLIGLFVLTVAMALPFTWALRTMLEAHLGSSLAAGRAADAVDYDWWQEFASQAAGLGTTFTPSIIGFAAVLENVSGVLDAQWMPIAIGSLLATYVAAWTFLSGGIIDRLARQRPTRAHGFFGASGSFFFRFLRLALLAGFCYWLLFGLVHGWLFEDLFGRVIRDVSAERSAFIWRMTLYGIFGALLVAVNVVFDYAKIRAVVEDRRCMVLALVAAARFVSRHPGRTFGLYALNALLFVTLLAIWALLAPGAGGAGAGMWIGFLLAQVYILARLFLKLLFIASQTALFQATVAHAAYTAAPAPAWPESPSAELIQTGG